MAQFEELLVNLRDLRAHAEKVYEEIPINDKVKYLFEAITSDDTEKLEIRQFSSILLCRVFYSSFQELKRSMDATTQANMRVALLGLLQKENLGLALRKKVCDIACIVARNCVDKAGVNSWPELLQFMFTAAESNNFEFRECALSLISYFPGIFGADQNKYLDYIKKFLLKCLCKDSPDSVKVASLTASVAFILHNHEDNDILEFFNDTALPMLQFVNHLTKQNEDEGLQQIIEFVERCPQFLRSNFTYLMDFCVLAMKDVNLSEKVRNIALEVIVSFSENDAATFLKRGQDYLQPLISHLLLMMTDIDGEEFDDEFDDVIDSDSPNILGEKSLDRFACGVFSSDVTAKCVINITMNAVKKMLQNADWKQHYAALMAISALGKGCNKQMTPMFDDIVNAILEFVMDGPPKVRYACCKAIGQMADIFASEFRLNFHGTFILALLLLLDDVRNPRIQAQAAAAFVNFFQESDQKVILQYADSVAAKFEGILSAKMKDLSTVRSRLLLEQVVVSIASLANAVQEVFIKFYDVFMPCLKFIIDNANAKEYRLLRGKAIECVSLIGLALKDHSEKFINDAGQIMNMFLSTQTGEVILEDDDPQLPYMITSWCRICQLLGSKFEPYLPMVMPQVMKTASKTIEMAVLDKDEVKNYKGDADWQTFTLNDQQKLGIKVVVLDGKRTACEMLLRCARELKHGFAAYVEETAKILVPLMKRYFHEGTRVAVAQCPPLLLECAKARESQKTDQLFRIETVGKG